jgi:hypothetical protein
VAVVIFIACTVHGLLNGMIPTFRVWNQVKVIHAPVMSICIRFAAAATGGQRSVTIRRKSNGQNTEESTSTNWSG